jgi:hypothetical protein
MAIASLNHTSVMHIVFIYLNTIIGIFHISLTPHPSSLTVNNYEKYSDTGGCGKLSLKLEWFYMSPHLDYFIQN